MAARNFVINNSVPGSYQHDVQGNIIVRRNPLFAGVELYGHEIIRWAWGADPGEREYTLQTVFQGTDFSTRTTYFALNRALEQLGIPGRVMIDKGRAVYHCPSLNQWPTVIGYGLTIKQNGEVVR